MSSDRIVLLIITSVIRSKSLSPGGICSILGIFRGEPADHTSFGLGLGQYSSRVCTNITSSTARIDVYRITVLAVLLLPRLDARLDYEVAFSAFSHSRS